MPLVVICGYPSSGKSNRAVELKQFLLKCNQDLDVTVVDDGIIDRNVVYSDRKCEIVSRSALKAAAERLLTNTNVVILDSLNYIKGFRYELFCVAKYARSTHCVLYCCSSQQDVFAFNDKKNVEERYSADVLKALVERFEPPNSMSRWDSPLFTMQPMDILPHEQIFKVLFEKAILKPNLSTQNPPLMSPSFLHEADKILQEISAAIISAQKSGSVGDSVPLPPSCENYIIKEKISIGEMRKKRKEFLSYLRANPVSDVSHVSKTFLYFLKS